MNEQTKTSLIKWLLIAVLCFGVGALTALWNNHRPFTKEQRMIIRQSDSVMYVTTWPEDSAILRTPCAELTKAELKSRDLKVLMAKMLKTLRSPQQDGVRTTTLMLLTVVRCWRCGQVAIRHSEILQRMASMPISC